MDADQTGAGGEHNRSSGVEEGIGILTTTTKGLGVVGGGAASPEQLQHQ